MTIARIPRVDNRGLEYDAWRERNVVEVASTRIAGFVRPSTPSSDYISAVNDWTYVAYLAERAQSDLVRLRRPTAPIREQVKRPLLGSSVANLTRAFQDQLFEDRDWLLHRALSMTAVFALTATILSSTHATAIAVVMCGAIPLVLGMSTVLTYAAIGRARLNVQLGLLMVLCGLGVILVAFVVLL
jgi:hypothetical protein